MLVRNMDETEVPSILLVEDLSPWATFLATALETKGWNVFQAADFVEAKRMVESCVEHDLKLDLILTSQNPEPLKMFNLPIRAVFSEESVSCQLPDATHSIVGFRTASDRLQVMREAISTS